MSNCILTSHSERFPVIDTSSVLYNATEVGSYTATQDCFVSVTWKNGYNNVAATLKINDVEVGTTSKGYSTNIFLVKKGIKISVESENGQLWPATIRAFKVKWI